MPFLWRGKFGENGIFGQGLGKLGNFLIMATGNLQKGDLEKERERDREKERQRQTDRDRRANEG